MVGRYKPDFRIVNKETGKEVAVVEVKTSSNGVETVLEQLKTYMTHFYPEVGLLVTPERTYIVRENFEGELVRESDIETDKLLGDVGWGMFESEEELGKWFDSAVFMRVVEIVNLVNNNQVVSSLELLSKELPYLLKNTKVTRVG